MKIERRNQTEIFWRTVVSRSGMCSHPALRTGAGKGGEGRREEDKKKEFEEATRSGEWRARERRMIY